MEGSRALVSNINLVEFRGVRRLSQALALSRCLNVIIGRNNVGKTSILEALYILAAPFGATSLHPYFESPLELVSKLRGGRSSLIYGYAGEALVEAYLEVDGVTRQVRVELGERDVRVYVDGVAASDIGVYFSKLMVEPSRPLAVYIPNDTGYYRKLEDYALREDVFRHFEKRGLHRRVATLVSEVVYDRFTEVLVRRDRLALRKEVEGSIGPLYVDVESMGEGVKRFILVYLVVEYLDPPLLLWDDVEVAMHPSLLRTVLRWLASGRRQVVVTTHSLDFLQALVLEEPRDARIILLRKDGGDVVGYKALTVEELAELLGEGLDVRRVIDELEL